MQKFHKENLPVPDSARIIHKDIVAVLQNLIAADLPSPRHPDFITHLNTFKKLFHQYQDEVTRLYKNKVSCQSGCSYCCYHWVEDVYAFEGEILADYIKKNYPEKVNTIIQKCKQDEEELVRLNEILERKLIDEQDNEEITEIDTADLLLDCYYQLGRPCALLSENGVCSVYPVRPLTCRIYLSFSDPERCRPELINESDIPTYLQDVEEDASTLLDALHEKYKRYDKSGLPALLVDYLEE